MPLNRALLDLRTSPQLRDFLEQQVCPIGKLRATRLPSRAGLPCAGRAASSSRASPSSPARSLCGPAAGNRPSLTPPGVRVSG